VKYGDLIQFEPIETVIQLTSANRLDAARQLVSTYVISEDMALRLADPEAPDAVFRNLQFETPADNKGLLIVGNYGTGKSHLMSLISAVAEHAELADAVTSPTVAQQAAQIAGKFKVIRQEIGATTMPLRGILTGWLEEGLSAMGVSYSFPAQDTVPSNKPALIEMMTAFSAKYPDQGLLLVVDELLDYLRGRRDQALILDLGFLREIGEVCKDTRFRIICGIQEAIFDNPRFAFVSESLTRVKDRFGQVLIARQDVEYVVAQRLLKKSDEQQATIRSHLLPFAKYYGGMNERLDDFVRLFPVHPDYVKVFEQIRVVEKRQVLKSVSTAMKALMDSEVPSDSPGLVAFDSFWREIETNPNYRTYPEVKQVIEVGDKLEGLVDVGYPAGQSKEFARRIIHGLCVHRLAVGDIQKETGLTAEALRDQLCLYDPVAADMGGEPAEDLRGAVETSLRLISQTVNGQFISATQRDEKGRLGGQFYLDVTKIVDYDAQLEKRALTIDDDARNRWYYEALKRVLECTDQPYVGGYRIWERELEWRDRKATRRGYLFFGAPNDRSTAVPERDFYIYFLEPFETVGFKDEKRADEVFYRLDAGDEVFSRIVTNYSAALDLASTSAGQDKSVYQSKAETLLKELVAWLRGNMNAFKVTHQGKTRPLLEWAKQASDSAVSESTGSLANIRDTVYLVASICCADHFATQAPEYPRFSILITNANRAQAAQDALRWMRGAGKSQQAVAMLDALELLKDDKLRPGESRYAARINESLASKGEGQVLNRSEIIGVDHGVEYMDPHRYRLEPELVAVLVGALVNNGDLTVSVAGQTYDATNVDTLVVKSVNEIADFKHVQKSKGWPLPSIRATLELVDLPSGLVKQIQDGDDVPVQQLQTRAIELAQRLAIAIAKTSDGFILFGRELLGETERAALSTAMTATKDFLDSVQAYKSPGQLKNFSLSESEVSSKSEGLKAMEKVEGLEKAVGDLTLLASYIEQAKMASVADDSWVSEADGVMGECTERIAAAGGEIDAATRRDLLRKLGDCKDRYATRYADLHARGRLDQAHDKRKAKLLSDTRFRMLDSLATIDLLPVAQLRALKDRMGELKSCWSLTTSELDKSPICPACHFRPDMEPAGVSADAELDGIDARLDSMLVDWTDNLIRNIEDPLAWQSVNLLDGEKKGAVEKFRRTRRLPDPVPQALIDGLRDVLSGLEKLTLTTDEVRAALQEGGTPTTSEELAKRFTAFLDKKLAGKDRERVRVVIE
jgi:energy-coupling factor transporter ATP-binding protein EcfA2